MHATATAERPMPRHTPLEHRPHSAVADDGDRTVTTNRPVDAAPHSDASDHRTAGDPLTHRIRAILAVSALAGLVGVGLVGGLMDLQAWTSDGSSLTGLATIAGQIGT